MSKYTPWFPPNVAPARRGFYERKSASGHKAKQYFTGSYWAALPVTSKLYNERFGLQWRGLSEKLKKSRLWNRQLNSRNSTWNFHPEDKRLKRRRIEIQKKP